MRYLQILLQAYLRWPKYISFCWRLSCFYDCLISIIFHCPIPVFKPTTFSVWLSSLLRRHIKIVLTARSSWSTPYHETLTFVRFLLFIHYSAILVAMTNPSTLSTTVTPMPFSDQHDITPSLRRSFMAVVFGISMSRLQSFTRLHNSPS